MFRQSDISEKRNYRYTSDRIIEIFYIIILIASNTRVIKNINKYRRNKTEPRHAEELNFMTAFVIISERNRGVCSKRELLYQYDGADLMNNTPPRSIRLIALYIDSGCDQRKRYISINWINTHILSINIYIHGQHNISETNGLIQIISFALNRD